MNLKARFAAREPLDGIVVRTPSHHVIEVLAAAGTRLVMIDTEHAPIGPETLDVMLAVANGLGLDTLVRVPALDPVAIGRALDCGATGVVVPHVVDATSAADAVRWSRYGDGGRGYSPSTRSAGWGTRPTAEVLATAAAGTVVVAQVEDPVAIARTGGIASTSGIDAVFVGAADLTIALGHDDPTHPAVVDVCESIVAAALAAGRSVVVMAAGPAATRWRDLGANVILRGTDQALLRT